MTDADQLTVTIRVGDQLYGNTVTVSQYVASREAERHATDEMLWQMRNKGIAYTDEDLRTIRSHWRKADGMPIEGWQR